MVSAAIAAALLLGLPAAAAASPGRHRDWRTYRVEVQAIDHQYVVAVNQAKATLTTELRSAKSAGDRSTARAQYTLAIVVATQTRDQSLVSLGPPPAQPGGQRASVAPDGRGRARA